MATEVRPDELLGRIQELSERVDELEDVRARGLAQELVASVIAMYGDGLERIMGAIADSRQAGATILDQLSQDGAVASLLLIHDLYPVSLRERVLEALDTVRPYMESHGGNVELVSLADGVASLALQGSCNGCAASRATLELAIKQALDEHAPDLAGLEVTGVTEPATPLGSFELPIVHAGSGSLPGAAPAALPGAAPATSLPMFDSSTPPPAAARWVPVAADARPPRDGLRTLLVGGSPLLLADVDGSLLAYADECASCGEPLGTAGLSGGMLRCPVCEVEFDLPRAGRAAGGEPLQLRPVPLLEAGGLRVAV
jgi:Fe-S cluster biogenesis protein NfuA/nitrite reductase/ring-hydroxylating ferredoxin subunit